jgi:hypothetical protein
MSYLIKNTERLWVEKLISPTLYIISRISNSSLKKTIQLYNAYYIILYYTYGWKKNKQILVYSEDSLVVISYLW